MVYRVFNTYGDIFPLLAAGLCTTLGLSAYPSMGGPGRATTARAVQVHVPTIVASTYDRNGRLHGNQMAQVPIPPGTKQNEYVASGAMAFAADFASQLRHACSGDFVSLGGYAIWALVATGSLVTDLRTVLDLDLVRQCMNSHML